MIKKEQEMEKAAIYIANLQRRLNKESLSKKEQREIEDEMSFYIKEVTKDSSLEEIFILYEKVENFLTV